jgi:hypothetical protein
MRYLAWFGVVFTTLLTIIYVAVFTPLGNSFIKPLAEAKIQEQTKMKSKFTTFMFNTSNFEMVLELNQGNAIKVKGNYSLFSRSVDFAYEVGFQNLESLSMISGMPLNGTLYTNGNVKGDLAFMNIDGMTDIGNSKSAYHATLADLTPVSFTMKMRDAKLASLLHLFSKNPYATADVDLEVNFKNLISHKMDGEITLKSKNGKIDPRYMKSDFNVSIPTTTFSMDLNAKLKGDDVDYRYDFLSNLFKISTWGKVVPQPLKADIAYALNIQDLEVLKPVTGADIRGALKLEGEAKGDKERLVVNGKSDIASSNTTFEVLLKDFEPASIRAKVENLKVEKLLYMLKQPHYSDGTLSIGADIEDARSGKLAGKILTTLKDGVLDSAYLSKAYEFKSAMPTTAYNLAATTLLDGDILDTKVDLNSNIANLDMQSAKFDIKENNFKSDYVVEIIDLNKLFFISNQHMRGSLTANGEINRAKDLEITMHSNVADGKIDAKLYNDDFHADISAVKTKKLLYMFTYPEMLDAMLNAKLDYNLAQSKGVLAAKVAKAKFEKNQPFDLIKQYVKFDMYKEFFNGDVNAKIDQENILASLDLRSIDAAIKVKEAKLNTKTDQINSDITLYAKKDAISATLNGDITAPKVTINLEEFMKTEAGKEVTDRLFKKLLK